MIFLNITDNPEIVKYDVSIPHEDVQIDDPATLHQTVAAQVIAFSLHALAAKTPPQMWFDKGSKLKLGKLWLSIGIGKSQNPSESNLTHRPGKHKRK